MKILPFILSIAGLISMIAASLTKGEKMKRILFFVFAGNFLTAVSYLVDGKGLNGAAACFLGAGQTLVNYFFDSKGKKLPNWLIALYAVMIVALNICVANGITLLSMLSDILSVRSVGSLTVK